MEAVILYPAIDLKDGQCVRLLHGDMDKVTVFNDSPADQASRFEAAGFEYLHVVDLNGAIEGKTLDSWIASFESDQALGDIPPL